MPRNDYRCILCGKSANMLWTVDNVDKLSVTYLCDDHSLPLLMILDAAGNVPPAKQIPLPDRGKVDDAEPVEPAKRKVVLDMQPLVDWVPPGPPPLKSEPKPKKKKEEDQLLPELVKWVKQQREDGKTWQTIGDALGISKQAAFERYRHVQGFATTAKE